MPYHHLGLRLSSNPATVANLALHLLRYYYYYHHYYRPSPSSIAATNNATLDLHDWIGVSKLKPPPHGSDGRAPALCLVSGRGHGNLRQDTPPRRQPPLRSAAIETAIAVAMQLISIEWEVDGELCSPCVLDCLSFLLPCCVSQCYSRSGRSRGADAASQELVNPRGRDHIESSLRVPDMCAGKYIFHRWIHGNRTPFPRGETTRRD